MSSIGDNGALGCKTVATPGGGDNSYTLIDVHIEYSSSSLLQVG